MKAKDRYSGAAAVLVAVAMATLSCGTDSPSSPAGADSSMIIDHTCCDINSIPRGAVQAAIDALVIAYGHTSHGSQLVTGMDSLAGFLGDDLFRYSHDGAGNTLELRDNAMPGDLGSSTWESDTRSYLDDHPEVNVVIWAWCYQVRDATEAYIDQYLQLMTGLERDYPGVAFVYMTGHLTGDGPGTNIFLRNQQIRDYCIDNDKILYDFADIESYDPDGVFYADRRANDNCDWDSDGNGQTVTGVDANWAIDWQTANPGLWYDCVSQHSQPLNANLKAYAAWYLWARLGGWDGTPE